LAIVRSTVGSDRGSKISDFGPVFHTRANIRSSEDPSERYGFFTPNGLMVHFSLRLASVVVQIVFVFALSGVV
jgi:hypothetical protein